MINLQLCQDLNICVTFFSAKVYYTAHHPCKFNKYIKGESGWHDGYRVQFWLGSYVGWLICQSQSDSKGFCLGTLAFLPSQTRLIANTNWLWCCVPRSWMDRYSSFQRHLHMLSLWPHREFCILEFSPKTAVWPVSTQLSLVCPGKVKDSRPLITESGENTQLYGPFGLEMYSLSDKDVKP